MSDTPRTDELAKREFVPDGLWIKHARELERENAALRDALVQAGATEKRLSEHSDRVNNANDRLIVEILPLYEDKARLDWLERSHYLVDFINEDIEPTSNGEFICTNGDSSHTAQTLRAAIDAARKEAQP